MIAKTGDIAEGEAEKKERLTVLNAKKRTRGISIQSLCMREIIKGEIQWLINYTCNQLVSAGDVQRKSETAPKRVELVAS